MSWLTVFKVFRNSSATCRKKLELFSLPTWTLYSASGKSSLHLCLDIWDPLHSLGVWCYMSLPPPPSLFPAKPLLILPGWVKCCHFWSLYPSRSDRATCLFFPIGLFVKYVSDSATGLWASRGQRPWRLHLLACSLGLVCTMWSEKCLLGFPGGAVVENLPANAGDTGLSPGLGRSHMPRSN